MATKLSSLIMLIASALLLILVQNITIPDKAFASCGPCEYRDGLFHRCLPKGGCIIQQLNPVTQAQKVIGLAQAIATGNPKAISTATGDILINSPGCIACSSIAHNVVPHLSDAQINQAVGQGFFVFLATGDPVLVVVDAATNVATQQNIKADTSALPIPTSAPAERQKRIYSAIADCIIQAKDGTMYGGWKKPPTLTDAQGKEFTIPDVDLAKDDVINLTAKPCPEWNNPAQGAASLTLASLNFDDQSIKNGGPNVIKYYIYGKHH